MIAMIILVGIVQVEIYKLGKSVELKCTFNYENGYRE